MSLRGVGEGDNVHKVQPSSTGFDRAKGEEVKFPNIFRSLNIFKSAENTRLCQEKGIQGAKNLNERAYENLTKNPPFGKKNIQGPSTHRS